MKKTPVRLFAERLLFEQKQHAVLVGDFAYSKHTARFARGKYWLCDHWVDKATEKCFYFKRKRYYRYIIPKQWE